MAVTLISALVILGIIMGLTPQYISTHHSHPVPQNLASKLGFTQMTTSWSFIFIYLLTLLSLGILIVRRLIAFRKKDYAFYLNHIGLWIILFTAGLGSADIKNM
ncbi:MAG: hypothetical protein LIO65_02185 [Odoribacter sp.]|nr:hypothetical protein [Odoribacter sp.]